MWLYLIEVGGFPGFYLSEKELYDELIEEDFGDELVDYLERHQVYEIDGISFSEDYNEIIESIYENRTSPAAELIRYLVTLVRCSLDEVDGLTRMAIGKYVDELDIPRSDFEEEYLEEVGE